VHVRFGEEKRFRASYSTLDSGGLALCGGSDRSVLSAGGRLVDECRDDTQLVTDALVMAIWRRGKPDALLHHSDRGSQYTSEQFQKLLSDHGIVCSMSRSGNVWDNAAMESFFSSLKTERTARKTYRTRDEAKADVFDYIERFYNAKRRHSTIGYRSPMEFEMQAGLA
jgi:putative transposase